MNLGFGEFLREKRVAKKMSIGQVALYANCSSSYLSMLERGVVGQRGPSPHFLRKLSKPLSVPYEVLLAACGYVVEKDDLKVLSGSMIQMLRDSLGDSIEEFAKRVDMLPFEIEELEEIGPSYETLDLIYRKLFERQRSMSPSQKELVYRMEDLFQELSTFQSMKLEIAVHTVVGLVEDQRDASSSTGGETIQK